MKGRRTHSYSQNIPLKIKRSFVMLNYKNKKKEKERTKKHNDKIKAHRY
mgnify:CR=1 FL=1